MESMWHTAYGVTYLSSPSTSPLACHFTFWRHLPVWQLRLHGRQRFCLGVGIFSSISLSPLFTFNIHVMSDFPNVPRICHPWGELSSPGYCTLLRALSEYTIEPALPGRLASAGLDVPPPFREFPNFPPVVFHHEDDSPRLWVPRRVVNPVVAQVVPGVHNRYMVKFRRVEPVAWHGAWEMYRALQEFDHSGQRVVVHRRAEGVEVVGISRGRSRFVIGAGISLFVKQVIGPVPDMVYSGQRNMVAVLACRVPRIRRAPASLTFHVVPEEYVSDPPLPEWLDHFSPMELDRWLPPPPIFSQGGPVWGHLKYRFAMVHAGISKQEWLEGGWIRPGGGIWFNTVARRGLPYHLLCGLVV